MPDTTYKRTIERENKLITETQRSKKVRVVASHFRFRLRLRVRVKMSQAKLFTLLGDSGIRGFVNKTSCRASVDIRNAQVLSCGHIEIFKESLEKARPESGVVIIACLTSFLADADAPDSSTTQQRIDPVLQDVREVLDQFSSC